MTGKSKYRLKTGGIANPETPARAEGWRTKPREVWVNVYRGTLTADGVTVWDKEPQLMRLI